MLYVTVGGTEKESRGQPSVTNSDQIETHSKRSGNVTRKATNKRALGYSLQRQIRKKNIAEGALLVYKTPPMPHCANTKSDPQTAVLPDHTGKMAKGYIMIRKVLKVQRGIGH